MTRQDLFRLNVLFLVWGFLDDFLEGGVLRKELHFPNHFSLLLPSMECIRVLLSFCFVSFFFCRVAVGIGGSDERNQSAPTQTAPSRWVLAQTENLLDIGIRGSSSCFKTKISNPPPTYSSYHTIYRFCGEMSLQPVSAFTAVQVCKVGFQPPIGRTHS